MSVPELETFPPHFEIIKEQLDALSGPLIRYIMIEALENECHEEKPPLFMIISISILLLKGI